MLAFCFVSTDCIEKDDLRARAKEASAKAAAAAAAAAAVEEEEKQEVVTGADDGEIAMDDY